jgi:HYR domain
MSRAAALATLGLLAFVGTAGTSATAAPTREPDLTVPRDMTVEAQTSAGSVVTFTATARGRDNASLPVDCRPPSGSRFGLGQTTVTCTAVDRPDEIATKRFRINVVDRTAPQLHVSADLKVRTPSRRGAVVTFRASASDLIDGAIAPTCSPNSGTRFPVGRTRVDCTAVDRGGNRASDSFTVTVRLVRGSRQAALFSPPAGEVLSTPPLLAWRALPRATYYNIQLFRNGHKILSAWPSRPRLQLHNHWIHRRRQMILAPGAYVWFVWPGFGDPVRAQYGGLLGRSTFRMT